MYETNASLQEPFLGGLQHDRVSVSIFLINGVQLQGEVESFDAHVIFLRKNHLVQMVYKHAISTVVPTRALASYRPGAS